MKEHVEVWKTIRHPAIPEASLFPGLFSQMPKTQTLTPSNAGEEAEEQELIHCWW